jgi:hypothetical protein
MTMSTRDFGGLNYGVVVPRQMKERECLLHNMRNAIASNMDSDKEAFEKADMQVLEQTYELVLSGAITYQGEGFFAGHGYLFHIDGDPCVLLPGVFPSIRISHAVSNLGPNLQRSLARMNEAFASLARNSTQLPKKRRCLPKRRNAWNPQKPSQSRPSSGCSGSRGGCRPAFAYPCRHLRSRGLYSGLQGGRKTVQWPNTSKPFSIVGDLAHPRRY